MRLIYTSVLAFFLATIISLPHHTNATVCQNKTKVVFGNGVFNDEDEAEDSREFLERSLGDRVGFDPVVALAYANDGGAALTLSGVLPGMGQLLELFLQNTVVDNTNNFWNWLNGTGTVPAPQWFLDGMKQIAAGMNAANYVLDSDVQNHVGIYTGYLKAGNKVLIVSHSQGNFYSNAAHRILVSAGYGNNVGIVAVATPAGIVEGGGSHITADEDRVIFAVRVLSFGIGVLPANVVNTTRPISADWLNHNFIKFYMSGTKTRVLMMFDIVQTENRLQYPSSTIGGNIRLDGVLPNAGVATALQNAIVKDASAFPITQPPSIRELGGTESLKISTCTASFTIDNSQGIEPSLKSFLISIGYNKERWRFNSVGPMSMNSALSFPSLASLRTYADPHLIGTYFRYCYSPSLVTSSRAGPGGRYTINVYELFNPNENKRCDGFAIYEAYPYFDGLGTLLDSYYVSVDKQAWASGLLQKIKAYYGVSTQ